MAQPWIAIERADEHCPLEEDAGKTRRRQATTEVDREIRDRAVADRIRSIPEPQAPEDVPRHGARRSELDRPVHDGGDGVMCPERFEPRPIARLEPAGFRRFLRAERRP